MVIMESFRKMFIDYKNQILITNYDGPMPDLDFKELPLEEMSSAKRIELLKKVHSILGNNYSTPTLEYYIRSIEFFFTDYDFKYILTNISISLAAIVLRQAFFFGLLLFDIIVREIQFLNNPIVPC